MHAKGHSTCDIASIDIILQSGEIYILNQVNAKKKLL